jgi:GST-like protein
VAEETAYTPPRIWTWNKEGKGNFAGINRPVAGPTHDKELPLGRHPLLLYSLTTPNGIKVTVMLEELLALGHAGAEYDAWLIRILDGEQFGSGFVAVNPKSQIPAVLDRCTRATVQNERSSTAWWRGTTRRLSRTSPNRARPCPPTSRRSSRRT